MRNLRLLNRGRIAPEPLTHPDLRIVDAVFDPALDAVLVAFAGDEAGCIEVQQLSKDGLAHVLAAFPSACADVLAMAHFADTAEVTFVLGNGEIVVARYDMGSGDEGSAEIVGLFDSGVLAAAWSPDEETVALVTGDRKLVVLSRQLEPIAEKTLDPRDAQLTDSKHVSVGWGRAETQFQGRGFKALEREREAMKHAGLDLRENAPLRDPTVAQGQRGTLSAWDDGRIRISWRGDAEFFAVSTVEDASEGERRVTRVFSRDGALDSVSEAVDGVEHNLAWRPSGVLIATTQRTHDDVGNAFIQLSFFERNGLRHGEFDTRLDAHTEGVDALAWSCDSSLLALVVRSRVLVWCTRNYHWYLKQELHVDAGVDGNRVIFAKFHPEKPMQLMVGTDRGGLLVYDFASSTARGASSLDAGMVAVVNGRSVLITPLGVANVPPPMAYAELELPASVVDVCVSASSEAFGAVTSDQNVHVARASLEELADGTARLVTVEKLLFATAENLVKQVCAIADAAMAVLVDSAHASHVVLLATDHPARVVAFCELETRAVLVKSAADYSAAVVECIDGTVVEIDASGAVTRAGHLPKLCVDVDVAVPGTCAERRVFGLASSGKLYCGGEELAAGVTSFQITDQLLAFTNAHAQLFFVHLDAATTRAGFTFTAGTDSAADERVRQIERGAMLVTCIPSKYTVVLQAPRGNLETISPRIMVLAGVRRFLAVEDYWRTFMVCRTHRIDLDLMYDYDRDAFERNAERFVQQINRTDYLDVFLSCLHAEDVTQTKYRDTLTENATSEHMREENALGDASVDALADRTRKIIINKEVRAPTEKVNRLCQIFLDVLLRPAFEHKFMQTRVTAYACQAPPDLKGALTLIASLDSAHQDAMVSHLCFLLDVNALYKHALELYDVGMALAIAQKSQMDPKDYLPFLQHLHVQDPLQRRFLVDHHLKHHAQALQWLADMGDDTRARFYDYVVAHTLYKPALAIARYDDITTRAVYALYADRLFNDKKYVEAALAYEYLGQRERALESYLLCKRWVEALSLACADNRQLTETARKLVADLRESHNYCAAAEIASHVLGDIEDAILLFCQGYRFDRAILLAAELKQDAFLASVVDVQLGEAFGVVAELVADCSSQCQSQLRRLRELRQKASDPLAFYGAHADDADTPDNVSVAASDTSTASFFTRYTGKTGGTAKSGASRKTSKNRKREEHKRAKGRKGTVYEEEYLIRSVGRMVKRMDQTEGDAEALIEGLVRRGRMEQAHQLQQSWVGLVAFLKEHIVEIHTMSERGRERIDDDGNLYFIEEIPVPVIREFKIFELLDF